MTEEDQHHEEDAIADSTAAIALVIIPVVAVIYWLSGLPTS